MRPDLGFSIAALKAFCSLESEGFRVRDVLPARVSYESAEVLVVAYQGRSSYELHIEVHLRFMPDVTLDLPTFIGHTAPEKASCYRPYMALSPESVRRGVAQLWTLVETHVMPIVRQGRSALAELADEQASQVRAYWQHVTATTVRPEAERAFRERRYPEAAVLYGKIESDLTRSEKAKLAYARKRAAAIRASPALRSSSEGGGE